jgi:hypothetical protein
VTDRKTRTVRILEQHPETLLRSKDEEYVGAPPNQIDLFSSIPGVDFASCWSNRVHVAVDAESDLFANVISADDLIAAKIASGREQDLADVQAIRRAQQRKPKA